MVSSIFTSLPQRSCQRRMQHLATPPLQSRTDPSLVSEDDWTIIHFRFQL